MTLAELAERAHVSRQTLIHIERDDGHQPRGSAMVRICEVLNDTALFWIERTTTDPPADEGQS
jgi:transcriptional regulator with XRE-family HTH domain